MIERVLEHWLDSASERSYQGPFCQILLARGFRILHSTRHTPIEFGKDVVAQDTNGNTWAFQLKGNPGGSLTKREFSELIPQLNELCRLSVRQGFRPGKSHTSVLVTNGNVEDEVHVALREFNEALQQADCVQRELRIWQRGDLLRDAIALGVSLWPSEIDDTRELLSALSVDGTGPLAPERLHKLLAPLLLLEEVRPTKAPSQAEVLRRISSGLLLTTVALGPYYARSNHASVALGWTMYSVYTISALSRHLRSHPTAALRSLEIARAALNASLKELAKETIGRKVYAEGEPLADFAALDGRYTLLLALLSAYWIDSEEGTDGMRDSVADWLKSNSRRIKCWGEAAIPQCLLHLWFLRLATPDTSYERLLATLSRATVAGAQSSGESGLAPPYYDYEAVLRHLLAPVLTPLNDPLRYEVVGKNSYFARTLFDLLVQTGFKNECAAIWPDLTRVLHMEFRPSQPWRYCLWRTEVGVYDKLLLPLSQSWSDLQAASQLVDRAPVPTLLKRDPVLWSLFLIVAPQRSTRSSVLGLSGMLATAEPVGGRIARPVARRGRQRKRR